MKMTILADDHGIRIRDVVDDKLRSRALSW